MTIDERINVLDRELARTRRHQRWTTLFAVFVVGASALLGFVSVPGGNATEAQPDAANIVRARMFVVEDENGSVVARLGLDEGWTAPSLQFLQDEKREVMLFPGNLILSGGDNSAWLATGKMTGAELRFSKGGKTQLALIGVDSPPTPPEERQAAIEMWEETKAEVKMRFPDVSWEPPAPTFKDFERRGLLIFQAGQGPNVLLGGEGTLRAALYVLDDKPALKLLDSNGVGRAVVGSTETETPDGKTTRWPESSLLLFGSDGELRWSAP